MEFSPTQLLFEPSPSPSHILTALLPPSYTIDSLLKLMRSFPSPRCGRPLHAGNLCFKCLDCCVPKKSDHIYCEQCFIKGQHAGHRVKYRTETYGFCDCGDESYIQKCGFCSEHREGLVNLKVLKAEIPNEILRNIKSFIAESFKIIVKKLENDAEKEANCGLKALIEFFTWACEEHSCFVEIFAPVFVKPLGKYLKNIELSHDCANLILKKEKKCDESPCKCSGVELFFRYGQRLDEENVELFAGVCFKMAINKPFHDKIIQMMKKYHQFFVVYQENLINYYSQFLKLFLFLNANSQVVASFFLTSNDFLLETVKNLVLLLEHSDSGNVKEAIHRFFHFFLMKSCNFPDSIYEINEKTPLFCDLLDILSIVARLNPKNVESLINVLEFSCFFMDFYWRLCRKAIKIREQHERKIGLILDIFAKSFGILQTLADHEAEKSKKIMEIADFQAFCYGIQGISTKIWTIFTSFLMNCLNFDYAKTRVCWESCHVYKVDMEKFKKNVLIQAISSLYMGFLAYERKPPKYSVIKQIYTLNGTLFKAYDLFIVKYLLLSEDSTFSLDFLLEILPKKEELSYKFLCELLCILICEDLSTINLLQQVHSLAKSALITHDFFKNKLSFLIIQLIYVNPQFKFPKKKSLLLLKEEEMALCLEKVAIFNEKNCMYKLKPEFSQDFFEALSFEIDSQIFFDVLETRKSSSIDIFKGNVPGELREERARTYYKVLEKAGFADFVVNFFVKTTSLDERTCKLALKLVWLFFDMREILGNEQESLHCEEILGKLNKMMEKTEGLGEAKKVAEEIKEKALKWGKNKLKFEKKLSVEEKKESFQKKKQEMLDMKMKIMNEFAGKQKLFMQKQLAKTQSLEEKEHKKEESQRLCCVCLQETQEPLNFLCHIAKENINSLLYSEEKEPNFYIFTCGHFIHSSCQMKKTQFEQKKLDLLHILKFFNESFCPYCKSLTNILLPLNSNCQYANKFADETAFSTKLQGNFQEICEVLKNLQIKPIDPPQKTTQFFEDLKKANFFEEEFKNGGFSFINFLDEAIVSLFERVFTKNLTNFLENSLDFAKSLISLAKECLYDKELIDYYYDKLLISMTSLEKFFNLSEKLSDFPTNFLLLFIRICVRLFLLLENEQAAALLGVLVHKFINQLFILFTFALSCEENSLFSFSKVAEYLENKDLSQKILGFSSQYYFPILAILCSFFPLITQEKSASSLNRDHEIESSAIFKAFSQILSPSLATTKQLCGKFQGRASPELQKILLNRGFAVNWLEQVETSDEFSRMFSSKTCEICGFFPKKEGKNLFLCVICGVILCYGSCKKENRGNLTQHIEEKHVGKGIFVNILKGKMLVIYLPVMALDNINLFTSRFGKMYNEFSFDLENYRLDKGTVKKFVNAICNQRFPQEFFHQVMSEKYSFVPCWEEN